MSIARPFRRTLRQQADGSYFNGGNGQYVRHAKYAVAPEHFVRAFGVIQKDFLELLDFIEPADLNQPAYSYRTHEVLMRTCIEIEANFRAIFSENGVPVKRVEALKMREVANARVHATTEDVPAERLLLERPTLQGLPEPYRGRSMRTVLAKPERKPMIGYQHPLSIYDELAFGPTTINTPEVVA